MFGRSYFGGGGPSSGGGGLTASGVWAHVLGNGLSAGQNLVALQDLLDRHCVDEQVQTGFTVGDTLRILAAVAAGKTTITDLGGGAAQVTFRAIDDSGDVVVADMQESERVDVTLTPVETS
jgi:hypothetical protein